MNDSPVQAKRDLSKISLWLGIASIFAVAPLFLAVGTGLGIQLIGLWSLMGLFGIISAAASVILGISAIIKAARNHQGVQHKAVCGIMVSIIISLPIINVLIMVFFAPGLSAIRCSQQLKLIGEALTLYATHNNNQFPPFDNAAGLVLLKGYLGDDDETLKAALHCPGDSRKITPGPISNENISYCYKGGYFQSTAPETVLVWDKNGNHGGRGLVLYADNQVEVLYSKEWQAFLAGKWKPADIKNR